MNIQRAPKPKKLSYFVIEPTVLFYALAFGIFFAGFTAGYYRKVCWQKFNGNSTVDCRRLGATKHAEIQVQRFTVLSNLIINVGSFFPSMALCLFLASFSDRWGRKSILLIAIALSSLRFLSYVWQFTYLEHNVYWLLLPLSISGSGAISLTSAQFYSECILFKSSLDYLSIILGGCVGSVGEGAAIGKGEGIEELVGEGQKA